MVAVGVARFGIRLSRRSANSAQPRRAGAGAARRRGDRGSEHTSRSLERVHEPGDIGQGAAPGGDTVRRAGRAGDGEEGAQAVADHVADVGATAREQASQVVGEASVQARDLLAEARTQVQEQARMQTGRLAENVRRLAHELRDIGRPWQAGFHRHGRGRADRRQRPPGGGPPRAARTGRPAGGCTGLRRAPPRPVPCRSGAGGLRARPDRQGRGGGRQLPDGRRRSRPPRRIPSRGPRGSARRPAPGGRPRRSGPAGIDPDPYEAHGQSQPPHVTPAYGQDPTVPSRLQPPAQGV
ncbi:hypothetical protein BX265_7269 [Streptomyces sp. TLI_235]|nr:hypothetical protein BX265_7269 [Streptomyces sp. TLI_235]